MFRRELVCEWSDRILESLPGGPGLKVIWFLTNAKSPCQAIFCQLGNQFSLKIEAEYIGEQMQRWFVPATGDPIIVQWQTTPAPLEYGS